MTFVGLGRRGVASFGGARWHPAHGLLLGLSVLVKAE